jgi:glycosyltransferase involved in cell wall biosynthesis
MSLGCLTISSNTSSLLEVNPEDALRFDPFDVADIAQKIDYVLTMPLPRKLEITDKFKQFATTFNPAVSAKKLLQLYENLKTN